MKLPNNAGDRAPVSHHCHQLTLLVLGHRVIFNWVVGLRGPRGLLFTNWWQGPIAEDKTHWTWRSRDAVYTEPLLLALWYRKVLCRLPKEKHQWQRQRDPQLDMQRMTDHGTLSPKQHVSIKSLLSGMREGCRREGRKSVKRQRGLRTLRKQGSLNQHDRCTYELRH